MSNTKIIYWDSCLFYEYLGDGPVSAQKRAAIDLILQDNKDENNIICTSVITHVECIPIKLEEKKPGAYKAYMSQFDGSHFVDIEISANILKIAKEVKEFYYKKPDSTKNLHGGKMMDTGDAIHLATAIVYGVDEFHSRDDDGKGSKVPLVSIYSYSGLTKICGKYELTIINPESPQGVLFDGQQDKSG